LSGRRSMEAGVYFFHPYLGDDKLVWAQIKEAGSFQTELQYPPARSRPQPPPLRRTEEPRAQSFRPGAPLNLSSGGQASQTLSLRTLPCCASSHPGPRERLPHSFCVLRILQVHRMLTLISMLYLAEASVSAPRRTAKNRMYGCQTVIPSSGGRILQMLLHQTAHSCEAVGARRK